MAVLNNVPAPVGDPIARSKRPGYEKRPDPLAGLVSEQWEQYFAHSQAVQETFPSRVHSVSLTSQSASIGATDMTDGTLSAGLYRVSYYARITTQEGGSFLDVALDWSDGTVTRTFTALSIVGDSTANFQSESKLIRIGALTPVRYSTTYTAVGTLRYALDLVLEEVLA